MYLTATPPPAFSLPNNSPPTRARDLMKIPKLPSNSVFFSLIKESSFVFFLFSFLPNIYLFCFFFFFSSAFGIIIVIRGDGGYNRISREIDAELFTY
jgi:ATP-dependent Zn protease